MRYGIEYLLFERKYEKILLLDTLNFRVDYHRSTPSQYNLWPTQNVESAMLQHPVASIHGLNYPANILRS